ncbi:MAG: T9SS type A sorting domain-containing protein [Bacteroidetes bacterium]|nr:T9SS type A sorting domain-containing protein [Bacteroidota bacterium]
MSFYFLMMKIILEVHLLKSIVYPVNFICKYTIPVGINDHNSTIQIDIYPNPANEIISINGLNRNSYKRQVIKLNDMTGRTIIIQPLNTDNEKQEINISCLSSGSYILSIESDGLNIQNKKVMITK